MHYLLIAVATTLLPGLSLSVTTKNSFIRHIDEIFKYDFSPLNAKTGDSQLEVTTVDSSAMFSGSGYFSQEIFTDSECKSLALGDSSLLNTCYEREGGINYEKVNISSRFSTFQTML